MTKLTKTIENKAKLTFHNYFEDYFTTDTLNTYERFLVKLANNEKLPKSAYNQAKAVQKNVIEIIENSNKLTAGVKSYFEAVKNYTLKKVRTRKTDNDKVERQNISKDLFSEILHNCPNSTKGKELRTAIIIARFSGGRVSEVLSIDKAKSKIVDGSIVFSVIGKGVKQRYLQISEKNLNQYGLTIDKLPERFTIDRNYAAVSFNNIIKKINKNRPVDNKLKVSFHSLRATLCTEIYEKTKNITLASKILGHENISTTQIYVKTPTSKFLDEFRGIDLG